MIAPYALQFMLIALVHGIALKYSNNHVYRVYICGSLFKYIEQLKVFF